MRIVVAAAIAAVLVPVGPLEAQDEPIAVRPRHVRPQVDSLADSSATRDSAGAVPARPNCWRPQPRPACPGFFLTEIGMETPLLATRARGRRVADGTTGSAKDPVFRVVWTFGFMGTSGANSHGATLSLTPDDQFSDPVPMTFEYRYRRWLGPSRALDGALGYRKVGVWKDGVGYQMGRGVTAMAGYTFNPYVGLSLRGDLIREAGRQRRVLHVGVRSNRLSETTIKLTAIALVRAAFAAIGVEWDDSETEEP